MDNQKYIFFIDIDETLVKRNTFKIDNKIIDEIKRLKNQGHIFVVSTGRAPSKTLLIEGIKEFDFIATLFGNLILSSSNLKIIYQGKEINKSTILSLKKHFDSLGTNWEYKTADSQKTFSNDADYLKTTFAKKVSNDEFLSDLENGKIIQLLVDGHVDEKIIKEYKNLNFYLMPGNYTDVSNLGADKSKCIKFFKEMFPNHISVAIGDSSNDIPMFKTAKISISMGNASDDIKKLTTFVTKPIDDDGLVYAFKNILKI